MAHYKYRYIPYLNKVASKHFPADTPSIEEAIKRTKLVFTNTVSRMGYARPMVSSVVEIGTLHCSRAKALPDELEAYMGSSGEHGVVYFSLGSTVRGTAMPRYMRDSILRVFSKLRQKVLWKWEGAMENVPGNVKLSKWIPQQDVLGNYV